MAASLILQAHLDMVAAAEHGGLEAGIFCVLHPGLDIVTVGADCTGYHTLKEKLDLASFHKCYAILRTLIELCAGEN